VGSTAQAAVSHYIWTTGTSRTSRPAFDLHYPHMVEQARADRYVGPLGGHADDAPRTPLEKATDAIDPPDRGQGSG
jgi:cytochrome c oxidase subunit I